ncbi:hypothetical protein DRE_03255 [Drechslerella stenobrocha 248]|uniref:Sodium/calcium exchanger membrane region domain-containing protein n=1 Tax=Drechslerella stenobrocha 248 TaxID=1043628 RepID=W7IF11_9PEZI|nr:hypothetical protein DRE_03255 [Drechslerella stenobrocha 248]
MGPLNNAREVNDARGRFHGEFEPLIERPTPPRRALTIDVQVHPDGESGRSGFHHYHFFKVLWHSSNVVSMAMNLFWPVVPVAIYLRYFTHASPTAIFATSYVAMIPVANLLGFAGQEFARKMPKVWGILAETTLGSIVEIILFMTLMSQHDPSAVGGHGGSPDGDENASNGNLIPVIQAAVLGSILTNLLLCLGLCFLVGGIRRNVQTFHPAVSEVGNGLMLIAGFGLLIPSAFYSALKGSTTQARKHAIEALLKEPHHQYTEEDLQHSVLKVSQVTSLLLMFSFAIYIFFNVHTNRNIFDAVLIADEQEEGGDGGQGVFEDQAPLDRTIRVDHMEKPKFTLTECTLALIISLVMVPLFAVILVENIDAVVEDGVPDQFLGLILLPLVEKAAEHLTAINDAWNGHMNFALYHCLGPSIQTALFNAPLVVIVGWIIGKPIDLNFEIFMIALLVLSILVTGEFLRDGECNYLEGWLLVIIYAIMAVAAWYYPNPDVASSNGTSVEALLSALQEDKELLAKFRALL